MTTATVFSQNAPMNHEMNETARKQYNLLLGVIDLCAILASGLHQNYMNDILFYTIFLFSAADLRFTAVGLNLLKQVKSQAESGELDHLYDYYNSEKETSMDNNKSDFQEAMRQIRNVILTRDANTDFKYSSPENEVNADVKNGIKKKKVYIVLLVVWFFILAVVVAAGNVLILVSGSHNYEILGVIVFVGVIVFAPVAWSWYRSSKRTKELYDNTIVVKAVEESIPGATCDPDGHIDAIKLYASGVVPAFSEADGSYLISYNKNGKMCHFSNISLSESVYNSQRDEYVYENLFTGQAYVLSFKSNLRGNVRVFSKKYRGAQYSKGNKNLDHKIHMQNAGFNEIFEVYATNEQEAFYVLTPYVMDQLLLLYHQYGGFGMAVVGDQIAIALNTGYYLFAMPWEYKEIEKMSVQNSKQMVQQIMSFAQKLENAINGRPAE